MSEHDEHAERLEREADDMERRSERLEQEIADAREDWERKRQDETIPGAPAPEGDLPPEANVTTSGDEPPESEGS